VYLYRQEPRELAQLLGVDVTRFTGELVPVIFAISFKDPGGYFLATNFQMRNQDVLFVANSVSVDVTKFLIYLNVIQNTVNNGLILTNNGVAVYNNVRAIR